MSTTIDERVVEMRFDNKHFESNVATSMSTLEKLKQKLNLSGATKGLENLSSAAKNNNIGALGSAADTVGLRFNAMYTIADQVLRNITTRVQHTAESMVKALTLDPITTGFQEYETQINAVQTILANTSSKGTTIDDVTAALDELNKYADLTIYNFTEMTRNIGTFTAAGIDLDTSVSAIQGIANLAAVSGSTSQQASTAMYQLSQALAAGTVKLMDWNSVVNAGMGGEVFQSALKETSELLGTGAEAAIEASGSFRESLSKGWLTAEVLTETLKKFTTSGAAEYLAEFTGLSQETVDATLEATDAWGDEADAIDKAAEALAQKSGKNKDEIKSALQMAKNAEDAATKVKTFSQLWDVMKEAAQSGWAKTWQLIIGDFEEAKSLLTPLSDFFTEIINKISDWRNNLLESALGKGFTNLADKINGVLEPASKAAETVTKVTDVVGNLDDIVNKVILGDFGNGQDRINALTEAGENFYRIQNKVNETLGDSHRYSEEQITAQDKLLGKQSETVETTEEASEATTELTEAQKNQLKLLGAMDEAQLRSKGYTDEQIEALKELGATAEKLGIPFDEFIDNLDEINGRWLLINSFKNIGKALIQVFKSIGEAWQGIFDPIQADSIFDAIAAFHKFTTSLIPSEEAAENLTRTFKGLFAVLDIVKTVLGGGINIAFKVLSAILSSFDLNILDVTANIGDALVAFRDWLFENNALAKSINGLIDKLPGLINKFKEWFAAFKETPAVQKLVDAIEAIRDAFNKLTSGEINISEFAMSLGTNLAKALKSLPEIAIQIGKDFIAGFQNGIEFSVSDVIDKIVDFCLNFVDGFKEALGVESPSWKAYETATDFFQGFINGAKAMIGSVLDVLKGIGEKIVDVFKSLWDFLTDESGNVEWGKIFAGGSIIAGIWVLKQFADAFSSIANVFDGVGDLLSGAGKVLKKFSKVLDGVAWDLKAGAIQKMAISIGILVAAIWVLTTIDDPAKLWSAVGVIATLAAILVALSVAMDKLSSASVTVNKKGASIDGLKSGLLQIGIAILLVAAAAKLIGNMDPDEVKQGFIGLAGVAAGMIVFLAAMGKIVKFSGDVSSVGTMMKKLAVAMILMIVACKLVSMLSAEDMLQGAAFAAGFAIFVIAITKVAKSAGNNVSKVGSMVLKLTVAMALMVGVCKLAAMLSVEEMLKGAAFAAGFVIFVAALVKVTKIGKKQQIAKLGSLILSISVSLLMMVAVCKLVGMLSVEEMLKGAAFVAGFVILLKVLVSILTIGSEEKMASVASTILAMSAAIAILAGVAVLLSFMDTASLAKGIIAVGILSLMMTLMVKSLKGAQNAKGAILMMAIAIGVMAASVVALSFIDTQSLIASAGAMTIMMAAFALMIKSMKGLKSVKTAPLIALAGVVVILAGIIYILQDVDPLSAVSTAGSLAVLMLSMAVVLKILDSINGSVGNALKGALALTALAIPMLAFSIVLRQMNGIEGAMGNVLALTVLMAGMTVLLAAVSAVGKYLSSGIIAGIVSLTAMVIPMLAFVWALKQMDGIEDASGKITSLVTMMGAMTILLAVLAVVGLGGPAAIIGIASLVVLFAAIGGLAVAVGALMEKFPSIQKFLDTGLPVLEQLAGSIGTMIGKFIGGIGEGLTDSMVKMGEDIAAFMDQLAIASDNASGIKGESFDGVKQLMDVMGDIALTTVGTTIGDIFTLGGTSMEKFQTDGVAFFDAMKAIGEASSGVNIDEESMDSVIGTAQKLADLQSSLEPIGGVISWFTGRDDLGTFGVNVGHFITSMTTALSSLEGTTFNEEALSSIIAASEDLATLQSSLEPIGGVITWFTGRDDLGTFGVNVGFFITSMKTALRSLEGVTFNEEALDSIITAATSLTKLQSSLEPIGGVITWFTGRDDLGTFGINVGAFITSMKTAISSLDGVTFNEEAMTSIIAAATKLGELQSSLEPIGGVISWFTGRDDLATFGTSVGQFISSMKAAAESLGDTTINEEALESIIAAAKKLAEFQDTLEPMGGIISWFTGRDDLGTFGTNIGLFADAMAKLKTGMGEDGISETVVASVINAGTAITELQKALPEESWFDGKMNLSEFSDYVTDFATAMETFGTKAVEIDSGAVSTVINTAYRIKSLIESLVDLDTSGVDAFTGIGSGGIGADGPAYDIACAIAKFGDKVADIDTEAVSVAVTAARQLKTLIAGLVRLDTSGIENFKPGKIGEQMKVYSDKVTGIDTGTVSSSISAANRLKNFISSLADLDTSGASKFNPGKIGSALATYSANIAGFDIGTVNSSISAANRLKNFISSLAGLDSSGVSNFKSAVESLAEINLAGIQETFNSAASQLAEAGSNIMDAIVRGMESRTATVIAACTTLVSNMQKIVLAKIVVFNAAGLMMMTHLSKGITSGKAAVISSTTSGLSSAVTAARGYYSSFYSAGSYLVSGFANGISANAYKAVAKARAMAQAATAAAKEALQINSPSKVFEGIGSGVVEGFASGIEMSGDMSKKAIFDMMHGITDAGENGAQSVSDTISNTISSSAATAAKTLEDYKAVVQEVLNGQWDNGQTRFDMLTDAGYDYATVQNMVNDALGNSYQYQTDFVVGQDSVTESVNASTDAYNDFITMVENSDFTELDSVNVSDYIDLDGLDDVDLSSFTDLGSDGGTSFTDGIGSALSNIDFTSIFSTDITDGVDLTSYTESGSEGGNNFADGIVSGLNDSSSTIYATVSNIGSGMLSALQSSIDAHSPSRETRKIGGWFCEGMIVGVEDMRDSVLATVEDMGHDAVNANRAAMCSILDTLNSNIDTQPTITPVLDLSNVESGAGSIASIFNNSPAIGFNGNIKATSILMNENSQNGMNDEVVSAINRLRKDLGNVGNTTYSINGVTYDDGSNIHDAISAVVRQARIGRRV